MRPFTMTGSLTRLRGLWDFRQRLHLEGLAGHLVNAGSFAFGVESQYVSSGRFQPLSSTLVRAPALPPSGKMPVTKGSSPMEMR